MGVYVRADKKKGRSYYWLVESHREGKRVIQKREGRSFLDSLI